MGWFEAFKDVLTVAQKADNVDLVRQLLELNNQALEMQEEIRKLKQENVELRKVQDLESRIIRHSENYLTLVAESDNIRYCPVCWGNERKLIQLTCDDYSGKFICAICNNKGRYAPSQHRPVIL